jgi:hypothetical protein
MAITGELNGEEYTLVAARGQHTESDIVVAQDIIRMCEERGLEELAQTIRIRYGMEEIKHYSLDGNRFVEACKACGISGNVQGHVHSGDEGAIRYPVVAVVEDIRKFEALYDYIKGDA